MCACVGLWLGEFGIWCLQLLKKGLGLKSDYRLLRWEKKARILFLFKKGRLFEGSECHHYNSSP